jgi:hypothetical protein
LVGDGDGVDGAEVDLERVFLLTACDGSLLARMLEGFAMAAVLFVGLVVVWRNRLKCP